jgi:hypothetical protein
MGRNRTSWKKPRASWKLSIRNAKKLHYPFKTLEKEGKIR